MLFLWTVYDKNFYKNKRIRKEEDIPKGVYYLLLEKKDGYLLVNVKEAT